MPEARTEKTCTMVVDGHAHLYACFRIADFLDRAARNLWEAVETSPMQVEPPVVGVLLLAETAHSLHLSDLCGREREGAWNLQGTDEAVSWIAEKDGKALLLIRAHQSRTAEGLEILTIASSAPVPAGLSIETSIERAMKRGNIVIVPWGFGKWWGRRGRVVHKVIHDADPQRFFLGDNGNRPATGRRPGLFRFAESRGIRVLPGSDPLPFPSHVKRVGRYGFVVRGPLELERPAASLIEMLRRMSGSPPVVGRRERLDRALMSQLGMQLRRLGPS